ncbi:MAG: ROK family protein [Isosphaeraceae bacterium]
MKDDEDMEEFRAGQQESGLADIDTLIERSSLGTPDAKSLRERISIEEVEPILDRANSLATGPFAVGIEILPRELAVVLVDHYGNVHGRRIWPLPDMEVSTIVEYARKAARDLVATHLGMDLRSNRRIVIGVDLGGPVDTRTGTVICYENNPTDPTALKPEQRYRWEGEKLAELIEQATGCRTVLENDASAFAALEQRFGAGQEFPTFATILIRDGVGFSMVVDNKLFTRFLELGHVSVFPDGRRCECGLVGDIESQAGRRAMRAVVREEAGLPRDPEWEDAVQLALEDSSQSARALRAFARAGEAIGRGIATAVTLFNPACVVIYAPHELIEPSDGNSRIADAFIGAVENHRRLTFPPHGQCRLVTRVPEPADGPLGAALIALSRLFGVPLAPTSPNRSTSNGPASFPTPRHESSGASPWA